MKKGEHFLGYGLPAHINYNEQVVGDTTWFTYGWPVVEGGSEGVMGLVDQRGSVVLYDYSYRDRLTTVHMSISEAVEAIRLATTRYRDADRQSAEVIINTCWHTRSLKKIEHGQHVLIGVMLTEGCKKHLRYRGLTMIEKENDMILITW